MKRYLKTCLMATAVFVLCLLVSSAKVSAASVDDLEFTMHYEGIQYHITGCNPDAAGDLVIPETYEGLPIAWINYEAFANCDKLTSVTIPDTVTEIGWGAFSGCDNLKSVTIGNGVEMLLSNTFSGCKSLTNITFGSKITTICTRMFSGCSSLKSITIPDNVTLIDEYAFQYCTALENIDFGSGVAEIKRSAFADCTALKTLKLPDNLKTVESYVFARCTSLQSVNTGNGLTVISSNLFSGCSSLKNVTIGSGVTTISDRAFENCTGLESIVIPKTVTTLDAWVFENCPNLRSITLEKGFAHIGEYAFANCTGLESFTIPDSVESVGYRAFEGCTNLKRINVGTGVTSIGYWPVDECPNLKEIHISDLAAWCKIDFDSSGGNLMYQGADLYLNGTKVTELVFPEGITRIADNAFDGCTSITSVVITDSVTGIGYSAFHNNPNLTKVSIGKGINIIPEYAFGGCPNLESIAISNTVTSIESYAFDSWGQNPKLKDIFYSGTEEEKTRINIGYSNGNIPYAVQWHYNVTKSSSDKMDTYRCGACSECMQISNVEISSVPPATFADVSTSSWQYASVSYAVEKNLMAGKGTDADGKIKFDPNNHITREEFVQVLYNAEDKPSVSIANKFPDVKDNGWYKNAVLWANSAGVASGMGNGNFGVGKNITRQDLAVMLYKYALRKELNLTAEEGLIDQFADGSNVSGYAKTAMNWAVKNGVLSGKGAAGADISTFRLDPAGTATRAECAAMLKNFMTAFGL